MPLWPWLANFQGEPNVVPLLLNCVGSIFIANGWPCSAVQERLGIERIHLRRPAVHVEEDDVAWPAADGAAAR